MNLDDVNKLIEKLKYSFISDIVITQDDRIIIKTKYNVITENEMNDLIKYSRKFNFSFFIVFNMKEIVIEL